MSNKYYLLTYLLTRPESELLRLAAVTSAKEVLFSSAFDCLLFGGMRSTLQCAILVYVIVWFSAGWNAKMNRRVRLQFAKPKI